MVRNRDTKVDARHGTMTPVWPDRLARIRVVDRGVRVMAVSIPTGIQNTSCRDARAHNCM